MSNLNPTDLDSEGQSDAVMILIHKDGKILFVKRGPKTPMAGFWNLVSGKIEVGETQEEAVAREALEEIGLVVTPMRKVFESMTRDGLIRLHWWDVQIKGGNAKPRSAEVEEIKWVSLEQMENLKPHFEENLEIIEMCCADVEDLY